MTKPDDMERSSDPGQSGGYVERVARTAIERLECDASLRASLSQDGYTPLLEWASDRALAAAANLGDGIDAAAGASMVAALLGQVVCAAAKAAEAGETAGLVDALNACPRSVIDREVAMTALAAARLGSDRDANARAIGAALRAATPLDPAELR